MSGFAFRPSTKRRARGVHTKPSLSKVMYSQPDMEHIEGKGLMLAGRGAPTIQSIIADEMSKSGSGISMSPPNVVSHKSAPHSGHSSGGALQLAGMGGGALRLAGMGGGALRLAGQRNSKSGRGFVADLPGQLLKEKLARNIKKSKKKGGRLTHPIGRGDKLISGEYDSGKSASGYMKMDSEKSGSRASKGSGLNLHKIVHEHTHESLLPALHDALNLPALKPDTFKKIVSSIKTKIKDSKSIHEFSRALAKKHLPVLIKMHHKKLGGRGIFDNIEGDLTPSDEKTAFHNARLRLTEPLSKYVAGALKMLIKHLADKRRAQSGGRLIKDPAKRKKLKNFFRDFAHGFSMVMTPATKLLAPIALSALGIPPPAAKALGELGSKGFEGLRDATKVKGARF